MVGWYDPRVLAHSAYQVAIANIFGRHSDTRLIEALASQPQNEFDYSQRAGRLLARLRRGHRRRLEFDLRHRRCHRATRARRSSTTAHAKRRSAGRVLVFGGDEVYPYPTRAEYDVRTETPYKLAFAGRAQPDVFAIPGNHDWYDSLVAFSRTFCRPERGFAGCPTRQTRSYFALKLPANWWLLAIDLQLGADLDEPQVQYFQKVAARMDDAARLIFCVPRAALDSRRRLSAATRATKSCRARSFSKRRSSGARRACSSPAICISTSATKTRRASRRSPRAAVARSCIPRTRPSRKQLRNGFVQRAAYPDEKTSRRLAWRNFLFPVHQSEVRLAVRVPLRDVGVAGVGEPGSFRRHRSADGARRRDERGDPRSAQRHVAGHHHRRVHLLHRHARPLVAHPRRRLSRAAAPGGGVPGRLAARCCSRCRASISRYGSIAAAADLRPRSPSCSAAPAGAFILGVYLFVSIRIFGRHSNEAFSSLRIQDFKQWLRLRIDASGRAHDLCDRHRPGAAALARRAARGRGDVGSATTRAPRAPRLIDKVEVRP